MRRIAAILAVALLSVGILAAPDHSTQAANTYNSQVLGTSGLVSYWRLDESSGTVATDSKDGNTGTYSGATLGSSGAINGDTDTAASFTSGGVSVANSASLSPTADLTLEVWARPTTVDTNSHTIMGKATDTVHRQYRLGMSSGKWRGSVYFGGTSYSVDATTLPVAGTWQHISLVRASSTLTIYVNGVSSGTRTGLPTGSPDSGTGLFMLGRLNDPGDPQYFNGHLDEAAIYNVALSATTLKAHYDLGVAPNATPTPVPPTPTPPPGVTPLFADEFDGTSLDTAKWWRCYGWSQESQGCINGGNNEIQWYLTRNVLVGNGVLTLRALRETYPAPNGTTYQYTSGMIISGGNQFGKAPSFSRTYGYAEARIKIPPGRGGWPAFWTLPQDWTWPPEIDILEHFGGTIDNRYYPNDHYGANLQSQTTVDTCCNLAADFHVYAYDWQPGYVRWYFDGAMVKEVTDPAKIPNKTMYLLLNLAISGSSPPDANTPFPNDMVVDYVRVYDHKP